MSYTIKPEYWLKTETDKVQAIVLMPKYWTTFWTDATLQKQIEELGIVYTVQQCAEILDELKTRGVMDEN